ncbi:MAG: cytochrome c-type biogenesis protein CcmH [Thermoanaerobaculia bacterium]
MVSPKPFAVLLFLFAVAVPLAAQEVPQALDGNLLRENPTLALARELTGPPAGRELSGAELVRVTEEVTSLMRCPVCQGLSVADSPTASAIAMKEEARQLLAAGFSGDQVLAYFERSYGEFIRLSPKPEGFNLVVWILPVAALLLGAAVIGLRIKKRSHLDLGRAEESAQEVPDDLAEYVSRVREEAGE